MATYTSHLNLKLPDYSDTADIKDMNENFKKIDDAIASGGTGGGTGGGIVTETDPTVPSWAKQPSKPTYTAAEVGALPDTTVIPTVPSALPNPQPIVINGISYDGSEKKEITVSAGDGGSITETDPTVPAWAKAEKKPSYTAEEVGALPSTYEPPVTSVNGKTGAVALVASDVGALPNTTVIPTVPTALKNPYPLTINGVEYDGSEAKTVTIESTGGGASVELDTTLTQYNKAADAGAVGNAIAQETAAREAAVNSLNEAIDAKGDPTDEQVSTAVNAYLDANPVSGGISTTAKNLLITILRSGVYTADQSANITALETALGGGATEPGEPDVPVEKTYTISNELINCTSSNSASSVKENASYSTTLTANDGYTLTGGTVTVTMGGMDITVTAYADGVITIAAVTGNIEIFASAIAVQAEAALPEDGLIAYFDYRTTTYDNNSGSGKTTIAPTKGSGQLYMWANNSISAQNEYGLKPANTRSWEYDQNGGTTATALGDAFTVIQLTHGQLPKFGFSKENTGAWWSFYPEYINASGSTAHAARVNGSNFNSDSKDDYNFAVFRADGATLTEIFDTSRTTYNGGDIDGFSRWLDTPYSNTTETGDTVYCTAMAIYNRALTDSEIEAAREFMKTLEVTA